MNNNYYEQVRLLVLILPYVAKEDCFALKGGSAINLFVRDMPRLSVDIDLQYVGFDGRESAFANINCALERIEHSLQSAGFSTVIQQDAGGLRKMVCLNDAVFVKIEPNYVVRGHIAATQLIQTSPKVQKNYGFAAMNVLSFGELYGSKICAALDRQHPRDLFDVKYLLENEGVTPDVKRGFIVSLLSYNRPPHELLHPNILNQEALFGKEFAGMTEEPFSYIEHVHVLKQLIKAVNAGFSEREKDFLVSFFSANPNWELAGIERLQEMPAVKWKLRNLALLKENNSEKFNAQIETLREALSV